MQHLEPKSTAEQSVEDAAAKRTIANGATARSWGDEDKGLANRRRAQGKWTDELPVGRATAPDELEGVRRKRTDYGYEEEEGWIWHDDRESGGEARTRSLNV
ncbi:hypothetical protein Purlil1_6052 [Purpureocillium lilacinum]|uniref:Uncharacterized protein n=1 Tax=Purpureocillium lilacinum TaxID=33203 RepID=A0ABR0C0P1_PURLI|nr:hypothetical protein Purlil1_6052 [Purpureocillium lilacinum]